MERLKSLNYNCFIGRFTLQPFSRSRVNLRHFIGWNWRKCQFTSISTKCNVLNLRASVEMIGSAFIHPICLTNVSDTLVKTTNRYQCFLFFPHQNQKRWERVQLNKTNYVVGESIPWLVPETTRPEQNSKILLRKNFLKISHFKKCFFLK